MSGHNKWSKIKNVKAKNEAQTSKMYTKIGREIAVAVKSGGGDPNSNAKLKSIIAKAKSINMPNDNITRAIKKASGELGQVNYESVTYEGYGPLGSAVMVTALTDNKNRTASDVRHAFDKFGGSLGANGCVSYLFDRKGVIIVSNESGLSEDDITMTALEAGADDVETNEDCFTIYTAPENFESVREYFEQNNIPMEQADIDLIPQNYVTLPEDKIPTFERLYDALNDNDDVQEIYHNVENFDE